MHKNYIDQYRFCGAGWKSIRSQELNAVTVKGKEKQKGDETQNSDPSLLRSWDKVKSKVWCLQRSLAFGKFVEMAEKALKHISWWSGGVLPSKKDAFGTIKTILFCMLRESNGQGTCWTWTRFENVINAKNDYNPSHGDRARKTYLLIDKIKISSDIKMIPSAISFVLWRRKVPESIVTNPHISVITWVGLCLSQS